MNGENLLETLSEDRLPAVPEREPEPQEPTERHDVIERGRSPEDVVQARETRLPADDDRRYEVAGVRYSARELEQSGKLEELAATHANYANLQQQYQQLAERQRAEAPAAPPPQITNAMIAQVYDQVAEIIIRDLVQNDLAEEDLFDAYPRSTRTLIGQLRMAFDEIAQIKATVLPFIAEVASAKRQVESQAVHNAYHQRIDELIATDPSFYAGLKNKRTRELFTEHLVEVGATVGQTTGEKAPAFLKRQWAAFNSDTILDAAKSGVEQRRQRQLRRFVTGEGTSSRTGVSNTGEQSLMDRLIANSGKIAE